MLLCSFMIIYYKTRVEEGEGIYTLLLLVMEETFMIPVQLMVVVKVYIQYQLVLILMMVLLLLMMRNAQQNKLWHT